MSEDYIPGHLDPKGSVNEPSAVSIFDTPTLIIGANIDRALLVIQNTGGVNVHVFPSSGVAVGNAILMTDSTTPVNDVWTTRPWWGVTESGQTGTVSVLEAAFR